MTAIRYRLARLERAHARRWATSGPAFEPGPEDFAWLMACVTRADDPSLTRFHALLAARPFDESPTSPIEKVDVAGDRTPSSDDRLRDQIDRVLFHLDPDDAA